MQPAESLSPPPTTTKTRRRVPWRWPVSILLVFVALAVVAALLLALNWPFTKQAVINALQESSVEYVTIDHFYRTYFPPGCVAEGVKTVRKDHEPPLIVIGRLVVQGSYTRLFTFQKHLSLVRAEGLRLTIPPKPKEGASAPVIPLTQTKSSRHVAIGTVNADGAILDFLPSETGKEPFRLFIPKLSLEGVGSNGPLTYSATISNPKPPGEIRSTGKFGPWNANDPGSAAVTGAYTLQNADLGFFGVLRGILRSSGKFSGVISHIEVAGTTDVPDFHLSNAAHSRQLATEFHAAVDATDGNTFIQDVIGHFDQTTVAATGRVSGENGKVTSLNLVSSDGRIEDLLKLFISSDRPPMRGRVSFHFHVEIPPQAEPFLRKLKLVGDFGIGAGKFTNAKTQGSVGKLSESAEKAEDPARPQEDPATVLSDLKGHVVIQNGVATLTDVSFSVPGAYARMHGTYNLIDYKVDLHGTLITQGRIASATSGLKSVLASAIAPLFRKKRSLKVVPFKITGSYHHTSVGLDLAPKRKPSKSRRGAA